MASIVKKVRTRWVDRETGRRAAPGAAGAKKVRQKSPCWYAKGVPGYQEGHLVPLKVRDKETAEKELKKLLVKQERRTRGLEGPEQDHAHVPLRDHLADFERYLAARGVTAAYVQLQVSRLTKLLDGCRFVYLADLSMARVQEYLGQLQQPTAAPPPLDPTREVFTRAELAAALGISGASLRQLVLRHRLAALGTSRDRRYPRATALALWERRQRGYGVQTANYHLKAAKQFVRWLQQDGRLVGNPLAHLRCQNAEADVRRGRRALESDEARRLLLAARESPVVFRGLPGPARCLLYATALGTGFRERELASLTPERFQLAGDVLHIELPARRGKNRRPTLQPINADLAAALRAYLQDKPAGQPVWPGTWPENGCDMLRLDLEAAGIPFVTAGPDGPLYFDFHGLRHTFCAEMDRAGISPKLQMLLARHKDPRHTFKRYGVAQLPEAARAVGRLQVLTASASAAGGAVPVGDVPGAGGPAVSLFRQAALAAWRLVLRHLGHQVPPPGDAPPHR